MSAFRKSGNLTGFSTGALEKGDYRKALDWMGEHRIKSVELSALRFDELEPLIRDLDHLDLKEFDFISFHAPSYFCEHKEKRVIELLASVHERGWNIIVHPDVLYHPELWQRFGRQLLIENMDRRKSTGRTPAELQGWFDKMPQARLCLDVAHARQLDTTLHMLGSLVHTFAERIAEIHISELDSLCRHHPLSKSSVQDYHYFADKYPEMVPIIIESMLDGARSNLRQEEKGLAEDSVRTSSSR